MIQNILAKLDRAIYMFGFAPDLKMRIAFGSLIFEIILLSGLLLFLIYIIVFRKNFNFLKKEVL